MKKIRINELLLWKTIHRISDELSKYEQDLYTGCELTTAQHQVLIALAYHTKPEKKLRISDLIFRLNRTQVSISLIINRMEKKGLVKKITNASDRREVQVEITKKGMALLKSNTKLITEWIKKIFSVYSNEEMEIFIRLSDKLSDSFRSGENQQNSSNEELILKKEIDFINKLSGE